MRSTFLLAATSAALVLASPVELKQREVDVVYDTVYTTVYVTATPAVFAAGGHRHPKHSHTPTPSPPPPPPPPSSSPEPAPAPAPSSVAPAPAPAPSVAAPQVQPASAPAAAQIATPSDYISTALYHHNLHRANHSAPAMSWGATYAGYAEKVAKSCVFAHDLSAGGGGYGQNLAMWASSGDPESLGAPTALAQGITNMWYDGEIASYPKSGYGKDSPDMSNFEAWGHYSQLIWAGTSEVGCYSQFCPPGTMYDDMGAWYSVCNYHPAGNVGGQYGQNVLPPLGEGSVSA